MPSDLLRLMNQAKRCRRQRRHMQRLANVARGVGTRGGMAMKRRTSNEVQQRQTAQQGQRAPYIPLPDDST